LKLPIQQGIKGQTQIYYLEMEKLNAYELLEVERAASAKEITKAYRLKALKYHPDKLVDKSQTVQYERASKIFHLIKQAYDQLLDPEKRQSLDSKLQAEEQRKIAANRMSLQRRQLKTELEARELEAKNKYSGQRLEKLQRDIEAQKFKDELERAELKRIRKMQQQAAQQYELEKHEKEREELYKAQDLDATKELE
ncbi:hypothetical protein BB560_004967, partial [Smittium megazygosporum]